MKPAPELQQLDRYPYQIDMTPRFGDMDALRHLNNVALCSLYEDARCRFQMERIHPSSEMSWRGFLANVSVNYLREAHYPDVLRFGAGIGRIGRTSYEALLGAFQKGQCVGTCSATIVMVDNNSRPLALMDDLRSRLETQVLV